MASCFPEPARATSESKAELDLFRSLGEQLGPDFVVLHSVAWIARPGGAGPREGETDILILHPTHGVLVVEVKGGRISLDYGDRTWSSTDRHGVVHPIKNPFDQARRGKFAILEKIGESRAWSKLGIAAKPSPGVRASCVSVSTQISAGRSARIALKAGICLAGAVSTFQVPIRSFGLLEVATGFMSRNAIGLAEVRAESSKRRAKPNGQPPNANEVLSRPASLHPKLSTTHLG